MRTKQRNHNEYMEPVALKRKSCKTCKVTFTGSEHQWRWYEYHHVRQYTITWFCRSCYREEVLQRLRDHTNTCHCTVNLIVKYATQPEWMIL